MERQKKARMRYRIFLNMSRLISLAKGLIVVSLMASLRRWAYSLSSISSVSLRCPSLNLWYILGREYNATPMMMDMIAILGSTLLMMTPKMLPPIMMGMVMKAY